MSSQLEDKDAIRDLLTLFCMKMDLHAFKEFAELFTEDGIFDADYIGKPQGRKAIEEFVAGVVPIKGEGPQRKHIMTNVLVEVSGDTGTSRSTFIMVREAEGQIIIAGAGRYEDQFARIGGKWLFKVRKLLIDFQVDLGLKKSSLRPVV